MHRISNIWLGSWRQRQEAKAKYRKNSGDIYSHRPRLLLRSPGATILDRIPDRLVLPTLLSKGKAPHLSCAFRRERWISRVVQTTKEKEMSWLTPLAKKSVHAEHIRADGEEDADGVGDDDVAEVVGVLDYRVGGGDVCHRGDGRGRGC